MGERLMLLMDQAWSGVDEICSGLEPDDWARATDCAGWTVKDVLAHVCGTEAWLLGRPRAEGEPLWKPWVRNPMGAMNELEVEARRALEPKIVLDEYRELAAARRAQLAALDEEGWTTPTQTPIGPGTIADFVSIRVMDVFLHEQDVRRAVGKPGHMNGDCARHSFDRLAASLPATVAKRAAAPDGSTVTFDVGAPGRAVTVGAQGGRGSVVDAPAEPTARLTMDLETFLCLAAGRWTGGDSKTRVGVSGDRALADAVLAKMNVMP